MPRSRCVLLLGGTFDPVHNGHLALGEYFTRLLKPDELRLIPAGNPWQKQALHAAPEDRVEMLRRAFEPHKIPIVVDQQEIQRHTATFTIDTLRAIRAELGAAASIVFLLGADQLLQLDTWHDWLLLFDYAHVCAASRPGFTLDASRIPEAVTQEFARRAGSPKKIRTTPHGLTFLAENLAIDISATEIRAALRQGKRPDTLIPARVLDYIEQHQLYKN